MTRLLTARSLTILLFLLAVAGSGFSRSRQGPVPGRFIVKLSSRANAPGIAQSLSPDVSFRRLTPARLDGMVGAEALSQYYIYQGQDESLTADQVRAAIGVDNIAYIEQDHYLQLFDFPTDNLFVDQWGLYNTGQQYLGIERIPGPFNDSLVMKSGTAGNDINLGPFYTAPPGETTTVVVAIIDSGTDLKHPELQGRFWVNRDEIPGNGLDDDHNGFVDDTLGYDLSGDIESLFNIVPDNDPTDSVGHGTHVAGIVAANADGQGVVGVAPWVQIMSVKILPNLTTSVGAAGIIYAVNAGADIINASWGSPFESLLLAEAVSYARANDVMVTVSSGNFGTSTPVFPAAIPESFAVGAGNSSGYVTSFSSYGEHIDLVAPGLDILSLRAAGTDMYAEADEPGVRIIGPDSLYYLSDGTSMAAPMAAGAAALLLSFRPDLSVSELEDILRLGARDLLDPWGTGDSLPGFDTISGYGYLDTRAAFDLLARGGIYIAQPVERQRYVDDVPVKIAPVAGYTGGWVLEYSVGVGSTDWQPLAAGVSLPSDSVVYTFIAADTSEFINLRLRDDFGRERIITFVHSRTDRLELTSPVNGEQLRYAVDVIGSAYGPAFDSLVLSYTNSTGSNVLFRTTGEQFDSLMFIWNLSGLDQTDYTLTLTGYFGDSTAIDTARVTVLSSFSAGWPQDMPGRGGQSPVTADLDGDGENEVIIGTTTGLLVYNADGTVADGFPAIPGMDCRCVPAVYDTDGDGFLEIIVTAEDGLHVFNHDGTDADGWPRMTATGTNVYGFPTPSIAQLGGTDVDSAITFVNDSGQVMAFAFNGDPHFYSLQGWFADFTSQPFSNFYYGGNLVMSADVNGDNIPEIIVNYSASGPGSGTALFDSRTGQPAFDRPSPQIVSAPVTYGAALADMNSDGLMDIITTGYDSAGIRTVWVNTLGTQQLSGWPVRLPAVNGWLGSQPTIADLDGDGSPEVLCSFFEFDIGALYIFNSDGTPYVQREGRPPGEAFLDKVTFGVPMVANLIGDANPEIAMRSGYILPGTGTEKLYILDYQGNLLPGWPIDTPNRPSRVFSSAFAPLVDDIDSDGLVELVLVSDGNSVYSWDFTAPYDGGQNRARLYSDNLNSGTVVIDRLPTDIDDGGDQILPVAYNLKQNYPNPFNPTTVIEFSLPRRADTKLDVFNILGRRVATLVDRELPAGLHRVVFDGKDLSSGVYLYRILAGDFEQSHKMVLVK